MTDGGMLMTDTEIIEFLDKIDEMRERTGNPDVFAVCENHVIGEVLEEIECATILKYARPYLIEFNQKILRNTNS